MRAAPARPARLPWRWLGRRPYDEVHTLQHRERERVLSGEGDGVLLLCEHDPVVTLGRRAAAGASLLFPEEELARRGIGVRRVERGGDATWHGPGQLVGYPILSLPRWGLDVPRFVAALEGAMMGFLHARGASAARREGFPGVWAGPLKVGAVGIHLRELVTMHGFALNLTADPRAFGVIVPCGIRDGGVTSLVALAGRSPTPEEAAGEMAERVGEGIGNERGGY